jgi:hypothetical protein
VEISDSNPDASNNPYWWYVNGIFVNERISVRTRDAAITPYMQHTFLTPYIAGSAANAGVEIGCCITGAFDACRVLSLLSGLLVSLIFVILTPLIWRRLVETLEKVGWISGTIAALFTLLPVSIQDLPTLWKFGPIIIAGIIISLTIYHSRTKSKSLTVPMKRRWAIFTHARRTPDVNTHDATQLDKKSIVRPSSQNGIYHYQNRTQFPFDEMVSRAERNVEMAAITFTITTLSDYNILKGILSRKVHLTCILLNPDSSSLSVQNKIYHRSEDLKEQIQKSLGILCDLKKKFNDLVDIRLYDFSKQYNNYRSRQS